MGTQEPFHILIIEDSPDDRSDIRRMLLLGSDRHYRFTEAVSGGDALKQIAGFDRPPDCILLDFHLPDMDALEILELLRDGGELTQAPVIVLTGSKESGASVIPAGAQDYQGKSWITPEGLNRAVENARERYTLAKERLDAMHALQASEEFSRTVFQSSPDCVKILDTDGVLLDVNEPGRCLLELDSPEQLIGTVWHENWPVENREQVREAVESAVRGNVARFDGFCPTARGNPRWWDVQVSAVRLPDGPINRLVVVSRDVTASKDAEMELTQSARRKDEFLAMLAHELRNPLAPLLTGMEIISRNPEDSGTVRQIGDMMKRQVNQMSHLIDDLLDVSRITNNKVELQLQPISLHAVLLQALESVRPLVDERKHSLTVDQPRQDVSLVADHHRLTQVVSNLLTNAAKYTPPGGRILVTAGISAAGGLDITVKDSGQGIAAESQSRIFNLFDQGPAGEREGLGIGLTLVRSLVEMHGGTVSVSSEGIGKGSEFRVQLPASVIEAEPTGETPSAAREETASGPLRILIADDGRSTADVLGLFFRMEGMDCRVVYDGGKAVEEALAFRPQLACFDLGMPVLDGFQAGAEVRKHLPGCYLVALSGLGAEGDRKKTAAA
ncbi:MAG: response regulator, partial [Verrucomicrobiaceae bacterium]